MSCANCGQSIAGHSSYLLDGAQRCLLCTLRYRPLLLRSALTALVVGTILTIINQGAVLLKGPWSMALLWEIPLTYAVPFCVATWGALSNKQTALVAKQAAEVDILSGGKLRLGVGVGWIPEEFESLGINYHTRGRVIEEQIEILRLLWSQEVVSYHGNYHSITEAGINPLPIRRSIPIWIGGWADAVLRRTARLGDGWLPLGYPDDEMREAIERLHLYTKEAGRDPAQMGIEGHLDASEGDLDEWVRQTDAWRALGATHIVFNTSLSKVKSLDERIDIIRRYKEAIQ